MADLNKFQGSSWKLLRFALRDGEILNKNMALPITRQGFKNFPVLMVDTLNIGRDLCFGNDQCIDCEFFIFKLV